MTKKPKRKVTDDEREISYRIAKQFYDGYITDRKEAIDILFKELVKYKAPKGSATYYIKDFEKLMNGESITHGLSAPHFNCYLKNVLKDYGEERLKKFLKGMEGHIEYYRSIDKSIKKLTPLHSKFSQIIGMGASYEPEHPYNKSS